MFNLRKHKTNTGFDLLPYELATHGIYTHTGCGYNLIVGDAELTLPTLDDCKTAIEEGINELKEKMTDRWWWLDKIADDLLESGGENRCGTENLLFLYNVRSVLSLLSRFTEWDDVQESIRRLLFVDLANKDQELICQFNSTCLTIKLLHRMILDEMYRLMLVEKTGLFCKEAQISGPWANLDLPVEERMWTWEEDEEYFRGRERSRKRQTRYNPEYNEHGFYYVWQDLTREPYKFEDMKKDSPYKSRHQVAIP